MTESTAQKAAEMFNSGASTLDVSTRFGGRCVYDSPTESRHVYSDSTAVVFDLVEHVAEVVA